MNDNQNNNSDTISMQLGQILGKLDGIDRVINANHESVSKRLEDMQANNDRRFDSIEKRVEHVETEQKNIIWKVASWSSLGGAIVAGGLEIIKRIGH